MARDRERAIVIGSVGAIEHEVTDRGVGAGRLRLGRSRAMAPTEAGLLPALAVDAFRAVAGVLLIVHYALEVPTTPQVLGVIWEPPRPSADTVFEGLAVHVGGLGTHELQGWFGVGAIASLLMALGVAPRMFAGLLTVMSASTYCALRPAVTLDDYFAVALPFLLVLMPTGRTLAITSARDWRTWARKRVDGRIAAECVAIGWLLLLGVGLSRANTPPTLRFGLFAAAACAVAPLGVWRAMAILPGVASLWSLGQYQGTTLACATSAALGGLFAAWLFTREYAGPPGGDSGQRRPALGVPAAVAITTLGLLALQIAARSLGFRPIERSAGAVLANVGIPSLWDPSLERRSAGRLRAATVVDGESTAQDERLARDNDRLQLLLRLLVRSPTGGDTARATTIRRLVDHHCEAAPDGLPSNLWILDDHDEGVRVAWYRCGLPGTKPKFLLADPTHGTPVTGVAPAAPEAYRENVED